LLRAAGAASLASASGIAQAAGNAESQPPNLPEWSRSLGPGVIEETYGTRSRHETAVRRYVPWLTPDRVSSVSFTPLADMHGIITPSGLHFERHHGGVPDIDPADYRLMIHGMVERPLIFTLEDLKRLPSVSRIYFIECPANGGMEWRGAQMSGVQFTHGMLSCSEWTGVPLKVLLAQTGLRAGASWLLAEASDAAHLARSIPLSKALDDAIIAFGQNGEAVRPQQGYPVRLVLPGYEGNMWIKWLRRIEIGDRPWFTRWETRAPGLCRNLWPCLVRRRAHHARGCQCGWRRSLAHGHLAGPGAAQGTDPLSYSLGMGGRPDRLSAKPRHG
jgi:sulfane dehydrogenase subunit SoxC